MSGSGGGDDDQGHPPPKPSAGGGVVPYENSKTRGVLNARGRIIAMAGHIKELERLRDELVRRHGSLNFDPDHLDPVSGFHKPLMQHSLSLWC